MHLMLCHDVLGCYVYTDWLRDQGREQEAGFLMEVLIQGESGYSNGRDYGYGYGGWGFGDGDAYGNGFGGQWPVVSIDGAGYGYPNGGGTSSTYIA